MLVSQPHHLDRTTLPVTALASEPVPSGSSNSRKTRFPKPGPSRRAGITHHSSESDSQDDEYDTLDTYVGDAPRPLPCAWSDCNATLGSWKLLERHLSRVHCPPPNGHPSGSTSAPTSRRPLPRFPCKYGNCANRTFGSGSALLEHLRSHHIDSIKLVCPLKDCRRPQSSISFLHHHMETHHDMTSFDPPQHRIDNHALPIPGLDMPADEHDASSSSAKPSRSIPAYVVAAPIVGGQAAGVKPRSKRKPKPLNEWFDELYTDDPPIPQRDRIELDFGAHSLPQWNSERALLPAEEQCLQLFMHHHFDLPSKSSATSSTTVRPADQAPLDPNRLEKGKGKELEMLSVEVIPRDEGEELFAPLRLRQDIREARAQIVWGPLSIDIQSEGRPPNEPAIASKPASSSPPRLSSGSRRGAVSTSPENHRPNSGLSSKPIPEVIYVDSDDEVDTLLKPTPNATTIRRDSKSPAPLPPTTSDLDTTGQDNDSQLLSEDQPTVGFDVFNLWFQAHIAAGGSTVAGHKRIYTSPQKTASSRPRQRGRPQKRRKTGP